MSLKICFKNEIHKCSKIPGNFSALQVIIKNIFKDQLPPSYALQYRDAEDDLIMIADDDSYKDFHENEVKNSKTAVKIFVIPRESKDSWDNSIIKFTTSQQVTIDSELQPQSVNRTVENQINQIAVESPQKEGDLKISEMGENFPGTENKAELQQIPMAQSEIVYRGLGEQKKIVNEKIEVLEPIKEEPVIEPVIEVKEEVTIVKTVKEQVIAEVKTMITEEANAKNLAQAKPEVKVEAKPEVKLEVEPEVKPEIKPEVEVEAKPEVKPEVKPEFKPEIKPEVKVEAKPGVAVHVEVTCNSCSKNPIIGVRYKCSVCPNFDFCEECEGNQEHEHPLIKIRAPKTTIPVPKQEVKAENPIKIQDPEPTKVVQVEKSKEIEKPKEVQQKIDASKEEVKAQQPDKIEQPIAEVKSENKQYNLELVREVNTVPETISEKDLILYKTIEIKNSGTKQWPKNVYLKSISDIKGENCILQPIEAGKNITVVMIIKSPCKAGKYKMPWRAGFNDEKGNAQIFGEPILITFEIHGAQGKAVKFPEEVKKEEISMQKPVDKKVNPVPVDHTKKVNPVPVKAEPKIGAKAYSDDVIKKARLLKEMIPDKDIEYFYEFVSNAKDSTIDELVENYFFLNND